MVTYRSFADQGRRYFVRDAVGPRTEAVEHPAAWRGADLLAHSDRWRHDLTQLQIDALGGAADSVMRTGTDLEQVVASEVPLAELGDQLAAWRRDLRDGCGVVCVRGVPVRHWGDDKAAVAYWILGHHLGVPGAQNPAEELLGHVKDYGEADRPMARLYRTADHIRFHCDAADVVGLLCLRAAVEGGQSRLASSVAVFNEVLAQRPDLVPELFEPFDFDRRDEQAAGEAPTWRLSPCAWDGSMLRTFWHSDYMRSAPRHDSVELTARRQELIDLYDEIANSPEMRLDMELQEGDIQLISNHTVIHSRAAYTDAEDPSERRHLLRLWLSLD